MPRLFLPLLSFTCLLFFNVSKGATGPGSVPHKEQDFCQLAKTLLDNCDTDFKNIRGKGIDSVVTGSKITAIVYKTTLPVPGAVRSNISTNTVEGYNYEALLLETDDAELFQKTYQNYARAMNECSYLDFISADSTSGDIPKNYPTIIFLKKGDKYNKKEPMPNSIQLRTECAGEGTHFWLYIEVYPKRK